MTDAAPPAAPRRLVTKAEFARNIFPEFAGRPCSKAYLSKPEVVEKLRPAMVDPENPRSKLDADIALEILRKTADPERMFRGEQTPDDDDEESAGEDVAPRKDRALYDTKKQTAAVDLQLKQILLAEKQGKTLSKDDVHAAWAAASQIMREQMRARNRRIAATMAGMTSERQIKVFLDQDDRALLESMSNELRSRIDLGTTSEQPDDAAGQVSAAS